MGRPKRATALSLCATAALAWSAAACGSDSGPQPKVSVTIVSGGDLGSRTDPTALAKLIDREITASQKGSASSSTVTLKGGVATLSGPPISSAGPHCLSTALADAGHQAGALIFVADLTWKDTRSFLYALNYAPALVHHSASPKTTLQSSRPHRLLLVLADGNCSLETATLFS